MHPAAIRAAIIPARNPDARSRVDALRRAGAGAVPTR